MEQIGDTAWFHGMPAGGRAIPLHDHLAAVAKRYLVWEGSRVILQPDHHLARLAGRFRWLSLTLPVDLLVAALAAENGHEPVADTPAIVPSQVERVLERGVAETHLHVGGAFGFTTLWTALMGDFARCPPSARELDRQHPPLGGGEAFVASVGCAAVSRLLLAAFCERWAQRGGPLNFEGFLAEHLPAVAERMWPGISEALSIQWIRDARAHLDAGGERPSPSKLSHLYRHLIGPPSSGAQGLDALALGDPLSAWLPPGAGLASAEVRFTAWALRYLQEVNDEAFATLFWQYVRVRVLVFRYVTQEPGTSGLGWFTRHYGHLAPLRGSLDKVAVASALALQREGLKLESLEVRLSLWGQLPEVIDAIRGVARQAAAVHREHPPHQRPEVGLVIHLVKESVSRHTKRFHADPADPYFCSRYGRWYRAQQRLVLAAKSSLSKLPELLLILRGLDVAGQELSAPLWPAKPLIEQILRASKKAAARLARERPRWKVPPLGLTYHAGEEYRRLVGGMRRVHELFEFGLLRPGDRLGHGVALGEDPAIWAERCECVYQPAEDRLDDLLWELARYGSGDLPSNTGRLELVRTEALEQCKSIYGPEREDWDLDLHLEARRLRHDTKVLINKFGYPTLTPARQPPRLSAAERLLYRYLTEPDIYQKGQKPVEVRVNAPEIGMLRSAQAWLCSMLAAMQITVESNPSSNLLIGDFRSIEEHPAFRLQPLPSGPAPEGSTVLLSVNDDDPLTFASRLSDEFAHLYFSLLRRGVSSQDALGWIDRVRDNACRSRFTLEATRDPENLEQLL